MASAFHLVSLPVGSEEQTLEAALDALDELETGETVFFSEAVAWTAAHSGLAYARLVRAAGQKNVNIVATLNLGGELAEDLPGRKPDERHHALVVFTRHSHVHVPQAKIYPDFYEQRGGPVEEALPVRPYGRSNLVRFDMDEQIVDVRFFIGADLAVLTDHAPRDFACDVIVAPARLPHGAEQKAKSLLADAREAGVASTALCINGHAERGPDDPICDLLEDASDAGRAMAARADWPSAERLKRRFYRYAQPKRAGKELLWELDRLEKDPKRLGRIPLCRPLRAPPVELGLYPITIAM